MKTGSSKKPRCNLTISKTLVAALIFSMSNACTREASKSANSEDEDSSKNSDSSGQEDDNSNNGSGSSTSAEPGESEGQGPSASNPSETPTGEPDSTPEPSEGTNNSEKNSEDSDKEDTPKTDNDESPSDSSDDSICEDWDEMDCEEDEAGKSIKFPGGIPQGSCRYGTKTCKGGEWSKCKGAIGPKKKDTCELGNDDNCNGRPTDHCACSAGETQECGSDVGACVKGELSCLPDGTWSEDCVGEVKPSKEICDGKNDENCDGKSDEENCECINGNQRPCGDTDVGACKFGVQTCSDGKWGRCVGAVGPKPERCDGKGIDEDCDGAADVADTQCDCNNNQRQDCTVAGQQGDCRLGFNSCMNGKWGQCRARFSRSEEVCGKPRDTNGAGLKPRTGDEDCDGQIDESDTSNNFMPRDPLGQGRMYMLDEDGDGYGAIGREGQVTRRYCNSQKNQIPRGFRPLVFGRENSDCGDCPGTGTIVNPEYSGQPMAAPNACLKQVRWSPGAFDYNCKNGEERKFTKVGSCSVESLGKSCRISGDGHWPGSIPRCGEEANWVKPDQCTPLEVDGEVTCIQDHSSFRKTQTCK